MSSKIIDVVNAIQDALLRHDVDTYLSYLTEDVTIMEPIAPPIQGKDAARRHIEAGLAQLDEVSFVERKVIVVNRRAALRYTIRLKRSGGHEAALQGVDVFEFDDHDKIKHVTAYWDPADFPAP